MCVALIIICLTLNPYQHKPRDYEILYRITWSWDAREVCSWRVADGCAVDWLGWPSGHYPDMP